MGGTLKENLKKHFLTILLIVFGIAIFVIVYGLIIYNIGISNGKTSIIEKHKIAELKYFYIDEEILEAENILPYHIEGFTNKYEQFLSDDMAMFIVSTCHQFEVDPDIAVSILKKENLQKDPYAVGPMNKNGTVDVGLFQLNDRMLEKKNGFIDLFWKFDSVEFNASNWKHNTYIAISYMDYLQDKLRGKNIFPEYIAAGYNGGESTMEAFYLTGTVPSHVKKYVEEFLVYYKEYKNWNDIK